MNETKDDLTHDDLRIARALEEDIIFGRLAPGARLTEDSILARFDVSRHFVRQALVHLEQTGMVERERNKGARVRLLTADEVREIYEVRELVTRQAALMIPLPAPPDLIAELEAIHFEFGTHLASSYLRGIYEANDRFHLVMFGACGNRYLVRTLEQYLRFSLPVRAHNMVDRAQLEISYSHHRLMIDLLSGRDHWVLAQLCVDHLQPSKQRYLDLVSR
jgi:DNA-binding GntR family transcriptional regulator